MNQTTYKTAEKTVEIPTQMESQLPIVALMKNSLSQNLPQKYQTPEGKKTVSKILFWAIFIVVAFVFYRNHASITAALEDAINVSNQLLILAGYAAVFAFLYFMRGHFVKWMHQFGNYLNEVVRTEIFKKEKSYIQNNATASLQLQVKDVKEAVKDAGERVTQVDGARIAAIQSAQQNEKEAKEKSSLILQINERIKDELEPKYKKYDAAGDLVNANKIKREINDRLADATFAKSEYDTAIESQKLYAQFANQIAKMVEVLRDNEASARIMLKALESTIKIITKKLETTTNINRATQNIAAAFEIKESWKFDVAMEAVNNAIANNIAQIRANIKFADQHRGTISGAISAAELSSFSQSLKEGGMKKLNLAVVTDASHDLTNDEIADQSLNIL